MPRHRRSATRSILKCSANRGIYHDGWYACTTPPEAVWLLGAKPLPPVNEYKWELYNIAEDYSQANDLAAKNPDKLKELQAIFMTEAEKYQVLPLDNSILPRLLTPRPSAVAGKTEFTYKGENANIPVGNAPSILNKDYTITAEITVPKGGAEGMIATMGGRFGGYGLYLLKGKPVFYLQSPRSGAIPLGGRRGSGRDWLGRALEPGKHTIVFDFKYDGPGPGKGGTGVMTVDGKEFAKKTIPHTHSHAHGHRRDLRHRQRYAHGRGRQLQAAVPVHRDNRQADLQTRTEPDDGGRTAGHGGTTRPGHGLSG